MLESIQIFDEIKIAKQSDEIIEYGFIHGNNIIVFIKSGLKGSCFGYDNKYLKLARTLNQNYGCSVITASNPNGYKDDFDQEMQFLKAYAQIQDWTNYHVYYMGQSNGGSLGLIHAYKYPEIKKLLCINAPLMINPHKLINGIQNFQGETITLVYGTEDPSFNMVKLFSQYESEKIKFICIDGADHNFSKRQDSFMSLPSDFFFKDETKL